MVGVDLSCKSLSQCTHWVKNKIGFDHQRLESLSPPGDDCRRNRSSQHHVGQRWAASRAHSPNSLRIADSPRLQPTRYESSAEGVCLRLIVGASAVAVGSGPNRIGPLWFHVAPSDRALLFFVLEVRHRSTNLREGDFGAPDASALVESGL